MIHGARAIAANSEVAVAYYRGLRPAGHVFFVPNGLPLDELRAEVPAQKSELEMDAEAKLVLLAGRLSEEKDVLTLIRAIEPVIRQAPDAQFVIFGAGPLRESLEVAAIQLGMRRSVRFAGYVSDLPRWILAADVVVSSSRIEGSPNVVAEAMVCRVPLVISDIPSHRALVGDGALYFPTGDSAALADCVLSILNRRDDSKSRMAAAAATAVELSVDRMATSYEGIYRRVLGESDA
jgi:glycosyltransferase involved in cell wall biosynthesis